MSIIKRNTHKEDILLYWNHNNKSNIGLGGGLKREEINGQYLISKSQYSLGRSDIKIFNLRTTYKLGEKEIDGNHDQIVIEPFGDYNCLNRFNSSLKKVIAETISDWFKDNKSEIKVQLHYISWYKYLIIDKLTATEVINILDTYKYNDDEAENLYYNLKQKYEL